MANGRGAASGEGKIFNQGSAGVNDFSFPEKHCNVQEMKSLKLEKFFRQSEWRMSRPLLTAARSRFRLRILLSFSW
jgi:hypothetical protein